MLFVFKKISTNTHGLDVLARGLVLMCMKGSETVPEIYCEHRVCANNHKGMCGANSVYLNDHHRCHTFTLPLSLARHATAKVRRVGGKYKSHNTKVYK